MSLPPSLHPFFLRTWHGTVPLHRVWKGREGRRKKGGGGEGVLRGITCISDCFAKLEPPPLVRERPRLPLNVDIARSYRPRLLSSYQAMARPPLGHGSRKDGVLIGVPGAGFVVCPSVHFPPPPRFFGPPPGVPAWVSVAPVSHRCLYCAGVKTKEKSRSKVSRSNDIRRAIMVSMRGSARLEVSFSIHEEQGRDRDVAMALLLCAG